MAKVLIELVLKYGEVNDEALSLIWKARNKSRLYLPSDIAEYTEDLFNQIFKIHKDRLERENSNDETRRKELIDNWSKDITFIQVQRPDEIFAPYLKLNIKINK